jgi:murein DD-endopeptidase MepM/ murein hydrolase activator NlpD
MRRHPVFGFSKMHKGTDFAAPPGTPIYAAGSGVVEQAEFSGAYGKFVLLRHNGRVETAYAHMSRIAGGMRPGVRVQQGDVIGYVGNTGRSTGPHLHYEVRVDRQQVNPMSVSMPVGRILEGKVLAQFKSGQSKIKQEFQSLLEKAGAAQDRVDAAPGASSVKVAYKQ